MDTVSQKSYLKLAIPFTLSTVTQPLLGAVDTAVVGRLDSPAFIGGVAIGTVIFNTLYWLFGFLRVATSGFAAQSLGENRPDDLSYAWLRPVAIATGTGLFFILAQQFIIKAAMIVYKADPEVAVHAVSYFNILIWGAPLVLIGCVNLGWLMGRGHVQEVLILQVGTNMLNIVLDLFFVMYLHLGVEGVATATLISQALGFLLGGYLITQKLPIAELRKHFDNIFEATAMKKLAMVNSDLFIRTVCLLTMTNIFVARGSSMGTDILAANAILFQIQYLVAYLFDGLANAASVFGGKYAGARELENFKKTRSVANTTTMGLAVVLILCLLFLNKPLLELFTDIETVLAICYDYIFYLPLFVVTMAPGLVYAGFYIGSTCSAPIRNSLVYALLVFLPLELLLIPQLDNHGLWIAFIAFCATRSVTLIFSWNRIITESFSPESVAT